MTIQKLASLIAKREGKKHQATIGDIREILKILKEIIAENPEAAFLLVSKPKKK